MKSIKQRVNSATLAVAVLLLVALTIRAMSAITQEGMALPAPAVRPAGQPGREQVGTLDIVITTAEGDATRAAEQAVRDGYDHLFAGGGDEHVIYFQAAALELAFERVIKVNTDGPVLETDRCRYDVLPRAARFLRARGSEFFQ